MKSDPTVWVHTAVEVDFKYYRYRDTALLRHRYCNTAIPDGAGVRGITASVISRFMSCQQHT
eukprot:10560145-Karenia_brevis.AAC.1